MGGDQLQNDGTLISRFSFDPVGVGRLICYLFRGQAMEYIHSIEFVQQLGRGVWRLERLYLDETVARVQVSERSWRARWQPTVLPGRLTGRGKKLKFKEYTVSSSEAHGYC